MFGLSDRNLPSIRSYQEAVALYEKNEKFDQGYGWRGIISKRDTPKRLAKFSDSIVFRYHHTDLVVWRPDCVVVKAYDSPSSVVFADAFLPHGISATTVRGVMGFSTREHKFLKPNKTSICFILDKDRNIWDPDMEECRQFSTYVLDRKKAAAVRKRLKDWVDWRDVMVRLHKRTWSNPDYSQGLRYLSEALHGDIGPGHYSRLFTFKTFHPEDLFPAAYILAGAVEEVKLPFGSVPKKTPYNNSVAWRFV